MLDEPIAGVDAESQRRFRDSLVHLIRQHGAGVLLVSHELAAVADVIDRVSCSSGGWCSTGVPRSSLTRRIAGRPPRGSAALAEDLR